MAGLPMGEPMVLVVALMLAVALAVASTGIVWTFERRLARLPVATRLDDLDGRVAARDAELKDKTEELRRVNQLIQDRDRHAAEVAELTERSGSLRAELAGLEPAREQIEEVKRQAAEVAEAYAGEKAGLDALRPERERVEAELRAAEERLRHLGQQASVADERLGTAAARLEEVRSELQGLQNDRTGLADEVAVLKLERASLFGELAQTAALAARNEALGREAADLEAQVAEGAKRFGEAHAALAPLQDQLDAIRRDMKAATDARTAAQDETAALGARKVVLEHQVIELEARICALSDAPGGAPDTMEQALGDLLHAPACLAAGWSGARPAQDEAAALERLEADLDHRGLRYDRRTVRAFHTALKINDAAQLSVLAGVSGTGKSLLPRCYAEAMGMRFLQVPVEPRWDSPQDLLGFYNYVEKGYRATDLARALVRMDPYDTPERGLNDHRDEMLLVLLDEMNLARVEYYFSEFLSRLEMRPSYAEAGDGNRRQVACLPIDIPGKQQVRLFPGHNVLFVGTMNDDESTQSLSDKVLDRSNLLQFPAPTRFGETGRSALPASATGQRMDFAAWRRWVQPSDRLTGSDRKKVGDVIDGLAAIMREVGRPFGHRLSEAMFAYVANYPDRSDVATPLADQVEMRILPKLRGVTLDDGHRPQFGRLQELIEKELRDPSLAASLAGTVEMQGSGTGQFTWRGFSRT